MAANLELKGIYMNINKIILMGRLTADPELRMSQANAPNTRFTIAVNRKLNGNKEVKADFFNCVAFRNSAEFVSKYFKKGSSIIIFGSVQFEDWTDKDGNARRSATVIVDEVQFGSAKTSSNETAATESADSFEINEEMFEEIKVDGDLPF